MNFTYLSIAPTSYVNWVVKIQVREYPSLTEVSESVNSQQRGWVSTNNPSLSGSIQNRLVTYDFSE